MVIPRVTGSVWQILNTDTSLSPPILPSILCTWLVSPENTFFLWKVFHNQFQGFSLNNFLKKYWFCSVFIRVNNPEKATYRVHFVLLPAQKEQELQHYDWVWESYTHNPQWVLTDILASPLSTELGQQRPMTHWATKENSLKELVASQASAF